MTVKMQWKKMHHITHALCRIVCIDLQYIM